MTTRRGVRPAPTARVATRPVVLAIVFALATAWPAASAAGPDMQAREDGRDTDAPAGVDTDAIADADITRAIENEYFVEASVPFHAIDVRTDAGIVTLSGVVRTVLARERAAEVASTVKGVRSVVNTITVSPPHRDDDEIRRDIARALLLDPVADSFEVDVRVADGVVTLTGKTDSWREKAIAIDVVQGVRGVKEIHDEIGVDMSRRRPDLEITREVQQWLDWDTRIDAELIEVDVRNGRVVLSGTVGSAAERDLATASAWLAGVVDVDGENLDVEWWARDDMLRTQTPALADEAIAEAIEAAFARDPRVRSWSPTVEVDGGRVTLSGEVSNVAARRAAEQDARNTAGVWRVWNRLKVRPVDPRGDDELTRFVRDTFARDPFFDESDLTVHVADGIVFLSGTSPSRWHQERAENLVARVDGVVDVVNSLAVRHIHTKSDWEIADDVRSELYWNPLVESEDIRVSVDDGVVVLEGAVDTWREWGAARDEALEGGARRVQNLLTVRSGGPDPLSSSSSR